MRTADLSFWKDPEVLEKVVRSLRRDPGINRRLSRKVYDRLVREREKKSMERADQDLDKSFAETYRCLRGDD
ncbi:MAG: hypothetical protein ACRD1R_15305 [Acidobacteriota bacterium]